MSSETNEKWKDVSSRIKLILEREELTAWGLARKIEVPGQTVSNIVNGRNYPGLEMLVKIINAFAWVTADWLVMGNESPTGMSDRSLLDVVSQQAKTIAMLSDSLAAVPGSKRAGDNADSDDSKVAAAEVD